MPVPSVALLSLSRCAYTIGGAPPIHCPVVRSPQHDDAQQEEEGEGVEDIIREKEKIIYEKEREREGGGERSRTGGGEEQEGGRGARAREQGIMNIYSTYILYCIVLYDIVLYDIILYYIILYYIVLYCIILCCIMLCCIVL